MMDTNFDSADAALTETPASAAASAVEIGTAEAPANDQPAVRRRLALPKKLEAVLGDETSPAGEGDGEMNSAEAQAARDAAEDADFRALLAEPRRRMKEACALEVRSRKSLAAALAATLEACMELTKNLPALWRLCQIEKVEFRTKSRPCLAVVKLVAPALDAKTASLYGQVLTTALDEGWAPEMLCDAILENGIVALVRARRLEKEAAAAVARAENEEATLEPPSAAPLPERSRRAPRKSAPSAEQDSVEQLRESREPVPLSGIDVLGAEGLVLILAEIREDQLYAYELDADPDRIAASLAAIAANPQRRLHRKR